jgi:hypothetical protein
MKGRGSVRRAGGLRGIACFRLLLLGANDFGNLQELEFQDFEQQPAGEQGK